MAPSSTAFPFFASIPPEIRIKIWQHACLPRVVTVHYDQNRDQCLSASRAPAILQTNHESRVEAQRIYKLCFGTASHPARIYFNPFQDILYLPRQGEMGYDETLRDFKNLVKDEECMLDEVRRVAIEHVDAEVKRPWEFYNKASLLRGFQKAIEITLVLIDQSEEGGLYDEVAFVEPRESPAALLRILVDFRQNFSMEEKLLENVSREMRKVYARWSLPTLKIKSRMRKA